MKNWIRRWLGVPAVHSAWNTAPSPVWTYDTTTGTATAVPVVHASADMNATISRISNGYIVSYGSLAQPTQQQHYVPGLKEAGEFITAQAVARELQGK